MADEEEQPLITYPNLQQQMNDIDTLSEDDEHERVEEIFDEAPPPLPRPSAPPQDSDGLDKEALKTMFPATYGSGKVGAALTKMTDAIDEVAKAVEDENEAHARKRGAEMKKDLGMGDEPYEAPDEELFFEENESDMPGEFRKRDILHAHGPGYRDDALFEHEETTSQSHLRRIPTLNHRRYDYQTDEEFAEAEKMFSCMYSHKKQHDAAILRLVEATDEDEHHPVKVMKQTMNNRLYDYQEVA